MPAASPNKIVAETIAKALVEAGLLAADAEQTAAAKIAGGQMTSAEWQAHLKPQGAIPSNEQPKA